MKARHILFAIIAMASLMACNDKKKATPQVSQYIDMIDQFDIDTIEARPQDTLFSTEVASLLRHYPELYYATKKATKAFNLWKEQETKAQLGTDAALLDVSALLKDALDASTDAPDVAENTADAAASTATDDVWPDLSAIDETYLRLLSNVPDGPDANDRRSEIGRTRRAWKNYMEQLQRLTQTLPVASRSSYIASITNKTHQHLIQLQQHETANQAHP